MILACLGTLGLFAQSTSLPTHWRYSHPDTKALVGIDWQRVTSSKFGQRIASEFAQAGLKARADAEGLALFTGVERLLLSSPGPDATNPEKTPVVIALHGKFDLAAIRKFVKAQGAVKGWHQKVELLWPDKGSEQVADFCIALVSPQTILAGDKRSVRLALDHHAAADPTMSSTPLYQRGVQMAAAHDIWFVSEVPPAAFGQAKAAQGPMAMFEQVKGFDGGLSFRRGLGAEVNLDVADGENAKNMAMGLQALLAMGAMGDQKPGSPAELLKKLVVAYDSTQVKLALSFDQAELDRGIDSAKSALAQGITSGLSGGASRAEDHATQDVAAPQELREDPAQPKTIKIYNAEGGTREIPLDPPK
jgi:hypothetical protein